jgi:outer membrane immunogenic protein
MKKIIALAAIAAACSTSAFAQVSNFTGASAGVNLDHTSVTTHFSEFFDTNFNGVGQQTVGVSINGAYGIALSNDTVLTLGANYSLVDAKAGNLSANDGSGTITAKAKNQMSLYVEPGYLVSEKTLAYGKVSYESAKVTLDITDEDGGSKKINGVGYGFGIRTMLDKNLSLQAEVKSIKYGSASFEGDTSTFKTTATVGTIGLGYKF